MTTSVTLKEAGLLTAVSGQTNTFIFQGEAGIGKSSMLPVVTDATGYEGRYIDCAMLDLGDLQMPSNQGEYIQFLPNKMFVSDEPIVVMLDEIGKAMRPVQNALLTLLLEHRIGNYHLPDGSIVFGTTNMATDGLGDVLQAHARNRVTFLTVSKPDSDQWLEWAINNDMSPEVMAWVKEYPHCLESYLDHGDNLSKLDNPYIFNPVKQMAAFVTPRSLAHASHIIKHREALNDSTLIAALAGTVGESAARDMEAFLAVADSLPKFSDVVAHPDTAKVPESPLAAVVLVLGSVTRVDRKTIDNFMQYLTRLPREVQFLFATNAMRSKAAAVVATSKGFTKWATENSWAV